MGKGAEEFFERFVALMKSSYNEERVKVCYSSLCKDIDSININFNRIPRRRVCLELI